MRFTETYIHTEYAWSLHVSALIATFITFPELISIFTSPWHMHINSVRGFMVGLGWFLVVYGGWFELIIEESLCVDWGR